MENATKIGHAGHAGSINATIAGEPDLLARE
jgi:hypothetical protein